MIFGQGFLPLALDKSISNCRAAVLVLVHPRYFISPVPTISGERSAIRHLGRYGVTTLKECQRREYQNYGMDTTGEKEKRTSKINVDGRSTSSHDNKKFGTRSMEKQRGMAFGFRKTATAVIKQDGWMDGWMDR